ncbi:MAG: molybdenum cofactor biosynthesis protein MoaE, partial [Candidatus Hydrogenedentota bacterium]
MVELTDRPIDPTTVFGRLSRDGTGSVVVHFGVVKPVVEEKRTAGIRFAPDGDLEGEMRALEAEMRAKWELTDLLLVRRMGELAIGDIILAAAVSAPGRDAAFG